MATSPEVEIPLHKSGPKEARRAQQEVKDRVEDIAAVFVEKHAQRKAGVLWAAETERLLQVEIVPAFGARRLGEITKGHVHDLLDSLIDRGSPTTANRALAVLKKLGNWSVERGIVTVSPFAGIKPPAPERARDRILADDEIRIAWRAFGTVGWPFGDIAKLLLLTGMRRDEVAEARWTEIDLVGKTWTIAKERSKSGLAHEIPLSHTAIEILRGLPRIGDKKDGFIFTTNGRTAVSGFSRAKELDRQGDALSAEGNRRRRRGARRLGFSRPQKISRQRHGRTRDCATCR